MVGSGMKTAHKFVVVVRVDLKRGEVDADGGSITLMELAAGQSWHEHHSVHPVVVQVLKGKVDYSAKGQSIILEPGKIIHTTAKLLHSVTALEDSTLMVIMLTGESHPEPNITIEVEQV